MSNSGPDAQRAPVAEVLVGRERESRALNGLLHSVEDHSAAMLLRGQVGIGKSALMAAACDRAVREGVGVVRTTGTRSEAHVPFAGLHALVQLLLDRVASITPAQREAVQAGFKMPATTSAESFSMAIDSLELIAAASNAAPLLIAVDDAHWLDASTAEVLGFVAHRLASLRVVLVMAVESGCETRLVDFDIPELDVPPLEPGGAEALIDGRATGLTQGVRRRVMALGSGNPLALHALLDITSSDPAAVFGAPAELLLTPRFVRAFARRFAALPTATQALLLTAAADDRASLDDVCAAASLLSPDPHPFLDDLAPALSSELVEYDNARITFCHPLLPAAIYQSVTPSRRRSTHLALAATLCSRPSQRAWHRAASIKGVDEELAADLEASALAIAHRDPSMSLSALERAAELSVDARRRQGRLLEAAEIALDLGQKDRADRTLSKVEAATCTPLQRARAGMVRDMIAAGIVIGPDAVTTLVDAAAQAISSGETAVALRVLQVAAVHAWWTDTEAAVRARIVATANDVESVEDEAVVASVVAMCDPENAAAMLTTAASRTSPAACDCGTALALGTALHIVGEFERSTAFLSVALERSRQRGTTWLLPQATALQAWNIVFTGDWSKALAAASDAAALSRDLHQPVWESFALVLRSLVAAVRGEVDAAESLLGQAEALALPMGARAVLADVQFGHALLALGGGRHDEAFEHLLRTFDPRDPAHHHFRASWRIGDFAEAAIHSGHVEEAREQFARCEKVILRGASRRLKVAVLYARALLADEGTAEAAFEAALSEDLSGFAFYRARLLLQYGVWLRRHRKIAQARMPLRAARDTLLALGAIPWAERARQELRAAREAHRNPSGSWAQLTEQELQIAQMVAQGLTNREVAQHLYISPRTVGCHLYRIFPKLGISSRAQLRTALEGTAAAAIAS
jgi:DNA-binding CsgD family transcriptional regulator